MRYTAYCAGEGLRSLSTAALWATHTEAGVVTDASLSAREQGVRPGLTIQSAKALLRDLECIPETDALPGGMDVVLQTVADQTPWVEWIDPDTCWFQLSGKHPPLRELRTILQRLEQALTPQQRVCAGFAETPDLARTLVEWSRVERVPGALYWRVGRQLWLLSPELAKQVRHRGKVARPVADAVRPPQLDWLKRLPILAFWPVSESVRLRLLSLGVHRLGELASVPAAYLQRQFGPDAWHWSEWLRSVPTGSVRVNYPPLQTQVEWAAALGEAVRSAQLPDILETLAKQAADVLYQRETGALQVELEWETECGVQTVHRSAKQPLVGEVQICAALQETLQTALPALTDERLERVRLTARSLRPLRGVQQSLGVDLGGPPSERLYLDGRKDPPDGPDLLQRLLHLVNHRFPGTLALGLRPTFRELRLQAFQSAHALEPRWG
ncbi:MAG: hypothetical protein K6T78_01090 [Alicyclobacillus sp.]|nr:hypothetical protein [Alicyclobacillus sp.]